MNYLFSDKTVRYLLDAVKCIDDALRHNNRVSEIMDDTRTEASEKAARSKPYRNAALDFLREAFLLVSAAEEIERTTP